MNGYFLRKLFGLIFLFVIFVFSLVIPSFASEEDLEINAHSVSYDKKNHIMSASGSVEAKYKGITIYADELQYNTESKKVNADKNFKLVKDNMWIKGNDLEYNVADDTGNASQVKVDFEGVYVSGAKINIEQNKVTLEDANFDSCGLDQAHYHISAREVVIYPDIDWVICYWGFFWLDQVPLVPIPAYLYDLNAEERAQRNVPPFPEVGSNDDDGFFIHERIAWHATKDWNGRITLSYYEKKGLGGGLEGNYRLDDTKNGNLRLFWNAVDNWWGGITHHYYFGEKFAETTDGFNGIFVLPKGHPFDFMAEVTYREKINYEKVSYYPKLELSSQKLYWSDDRVSWDFSVAGGAVTEESSGVGVAFANFALGAYYDIPLDGIGTLVPSVNFNHHLYGNGNSWVRATQGLEYKKAFGDVFGFSLGYQHYLYNIGVSPFNFENYMFIPSDEINTRWMLQFWDHEIAVHTDNYLPNFDPKDIDYILSLGLHCYDIILTYRVMRHEFNFGFGLH
ncbi:MAG: hypothetical protein KKB81_02250 [Candidatus Margulisbacteria bacterium]|nr:hypothetical protein [Candidatus Margulisiibacteriota bacterium]MBU1022604.1 hypothetical protein [Candidatus Margulisiibacteriota bacterium]MBU1728890.1 hypothetical protein [Candidatus Margulisiibacteriota bacterium]MBU1955522.1 hypothetical protein [Candidatus Margulisiibacteriota bacterium]